MSDVAYQNEPAHYFTVTLLEDQPTRFGATLTNELAAMNAAHEELARHLGHPLKDAYSIIVVRIWKSTVSGRTESETVTAVAMSELEATMAERGEREGVT